MSNSSSHFCIDITFKTSPAACPSTSKFILDRSFDIPLLRYPKKIGPTGATQLFDFLESKGTASHVVFSFVHQLYLSMNDIGDDGIS